MGRCLAFNFSPYELKQKLKGVKYFVYSPDFDGSAQRADQYFFAALEPNANLKELQGLSLKGSTLRILGENPLFVALDSIEKHGAITEAQITDVRLVDQKLTELGCQSASFTRYQDVVFSEDHSRAAELKKSFRPPGAFPVPIQKHWFSGSSHEEAMKLYQTSQKR